MNIELAAPSDLIPELPGWRDRCRYIGRESRISFYHCDPYSQALAKIERGHDQDVRDVKTMLEEGLVEARKLLSFYKDIEPQLYKYPAIDPATFSQSVRAIAEKYPD